METTQLSELAYEFIVTDDPKIQEIDAILQDQS
jgi:hypothetical protein